jgi:hypothetical protein
MSIAVGEKIAERHRHLERQPSQQRDMFLSVEPLRRILSPDNPPA